MFEAGAIIFRLQAAGAQVFTQELRQADQAAKGAAKSTSDAAKSTENLGKQQDTTAPKTKRWFDSLYSLSDRQKQASRELGTAFLAVGVAVTAMVGLAVAKWADFDQAMSNVRAATMATAEEQARLKDAALDAGAATAYSAREAADAEEELAKAGLSVSEIVGGGLSASLSLAAAGQLAVARSAEIMATTLKQYKLPAEQASHVSDLLAAGAGKAQGSVDDLALALQYVGPVAAGLNISLDETVGTLALFASQGQLGERAGTGLRGVLQSLVSPAALASKTMKQYGVEIFNADGSMKSLSQVSQELKVAFGGLTEAERSNALGRIFGNEQITAARVLYEGGARAVEEWTAAVNESGYAERQAAIRQDNLRGDIEKLGGAFDTVLIQSGSGANEVLREMVQAVTGLIDWIGELDEGTLQLAVGVGAVVGSLSLAVGIAAKGLPAFLNLRDAIKDIGISGKAAAIGVGAVGAAISVATIIIGALIQKQVEWRNGVDEIADSYDTATGAITDYTRQLVVKKLEEMGALESARKLGIDLALVTDAALGNAEALKTVREQTDAAVNGAADFGDRMAKGYAAADLTEDLNHVTGQVNESKDAWQRKADAGKKAADADRENAKTLGTVGAAAEDATGAIDDLANALRNYNDQQFTADDALADFKQSVLDAQKAIGEEGFTATLDQNTQAGIDNARMLRAIAEDANKAAAEQYALTGNQNDANAVLEEGRAKLEELGKQFELSGGDLDAFIDKYLASPKDFTYQVAVNTSQATKDLEAWIQTASGKRVQIDVGGPASIYSARGYADGGFRSPQVRYMADGGVPRLSTQSAQFRSAGSYVMWAEDSTKGETFIPHAPEKRPRSTQLLAETAHLFGYDLVPQGRRQASDAAIMAGSGRSEPQRVTGTLTLDMTNGEAYIDGVLLRRLG